MDESVKTLKYELVTFMPETLMPGVLYSSFEYAVAIHLCACGCGIETVTPLKKGGWELSLTEDLKPTLQPSIGNQKLACKSHYWIREGKVVWA